MKLLRIVVLLCPLVGLAAGCVGSDGPSLFVLGNAPPDDVCVVDPTTELFKLQGQYDPSRGDPYTFLPVFLNQLTPLSREDRAEPNTIAVTGVTVTLEDTNGAALSLGTLPNPYRVTMSTTVPVGDGTAAGRAAGGVGIIPSSYAPVIAGLAGTGSLQIIARLEFEGATLADTTVTAPDFIWPITVGVANPVCPLNPLSRAACFPCQDGAVCPNEAPCECGLPGAANCMGGAPCMCADSIPCVEGVCGGMM